MFVGEASPYLKCRMWPRGRLPLYGMQITTTIIPLIDVIRSFANIAVVWFVCGDDIGASRRRMDVVAN